MGLELRLRRSMRDFVEIYEQVPGIHNALTIETALPCYL